MPALGIDIGGTSVKAAAVEAGSHTVTLGHSRPYHRPDTATLVSAIKEATANASDSIETVGLCLPGSWDESRGLVTYSINVPGVVDVPPELLVRNAGIRAARVSCFTDAHAAAYGAYSAERCTGRFLAISIGTGVGAAVLDDGKLLVVTGRSSGHMGQWDVSMDEPTAPPVGPDGGRGGLEGYISIPSAHATARMPTSPASAQTMHPSAPWPAPSGSPTLSTGRTTCASSAASARGSRTCCPRCAAMLRPTSPR